MRRKLNLFISKQIISIQENLIWDYAAVGRILDYSHINKQKGWQILLSIEEEKPLHKEQNWHFALKNRPG